MTAVDRLRERLIANGWKLGGVDINREMNPTPEQIAEEILKGLDAIERGDYEVLEFNDSHGHIDQNEFRQLANQAFGEKVDNDFFGKPITNYDVLLDGAYGPAIMRLVTLAVKTYAHLVKPQPEHQFTSDSKVAIGKIMESIQVFASNYSLLGSRFDKGELREVCGERLKETYELVCALSTKNSLNNDHQQIIYSLERTAKDLEIQRDKFLMENNYSAEFPAGDAANLRAAIELIRAMPQQPGEYHADALRWRHWKSIYNHFNWANFTSAENAQACVDVSMKS